jgi:Ankyrin repeats (3 copies)/Sel1 repeat
VERSAKKTLDIISDSTHVAGSQSEKLTSSGGVMKKVSALTASLLVVLFWCDVYFAASQTIHTQLVKAVKVGDREQVVSLLKAGANPNTTTAKGSSVLMLACAKGNVGIVEALIDNGVNVNQKNPTGLTALMVAAYNGDIDLVRLLVHGGADIGAKNREGETALTIATRRGHTEAGSLLASNKYAQPSSEDPDADPDFLAATALHMNRQWFLAKLDAKRILPIADACRAGGFSGRGAKSLTPSLEKFRSRFRETEWKIFINSSRANETSNEKPGIGNSLFTHYLFKARKGCAEKDGVVSFKEACLCMYCAVEDETRGFQKAQMEGRLAGTFPLSLTVHVKADVTFRIPPQTTKKADRPAGSQDYAGNAKRLLKMLDRLAIAAARKEPYGMYLGRDVVNWLRHAAAQGNTDAHFHLGRMYERGLGVTKDYTEGFKWYRKAVEQDHEKSGKC